MRILHLTDIHFTANDSDKVDFHTSLFDYITTYFSTNPLPDAVVLSGDFGEQCEVNNVKGAIEWLEKLLLKLNISSDKVIVSPGNHDIIKSHLPVEHHTVRMDYGKAIRYVENLNGKEYELYESIKNAIAPSFLTIRVIENVRFITLNSSWLSQHKDEAKADLVEDLLKSSGGSDIKIMEALFEKFGASFTIDRVAKDLSNTKKPLPALDNILNLSENKTQQLGLYHKYGDLSNLLKEMDDDKLNVLVFHHPETHLHPFERYPVEISNEEYSTYYYLTLKSQLLICGHTHPAEAEDIAMAKRYLQHNFVGGGAHYRKGINAATPMFYIYDIQSSEAAKVFDLKKIMFVYDEGKFKMDSITSKSDPIKILLSQNRIGIDVNGFATPKISIEAFLKMKAQLRTYLATELLDTLQKLDSTFILNRHFEIVDIKNGKKTYNILRHRNTLESENMAIPIIFDAYFCDELDFGPERNSVASLIKNGYDQHNKKECIYYALFVNPYSAFVNDKRFQETCNRINNDLDLFCSEYGIVLKGIYSSVRTFYPKIMELPDVTFLQKIIHVDDTVCKLASEFAA